MLCILLLQNVEYAKLNQCTLFFVVRSRLLYRKITRNGAEYSKNTKKVAQRKIGLIYPNKITFHSSSS